MSKNKIVLRRWIGFCNDKPHDGYTLDTYRDHPFDSITLFKSRDEARYRFQDVRRCEVVITTRKYRSKKK